MINSKGQGVCSCTELKWEIYNFVCIIKKKKRLLLNKESTRIILKAKSGVSKNVISYLFKKLLFILIFKGSKPVVSASSQDSEKVLQRYVAKILTIDAAFCNLRKWEKCKKLLFFNHPWLGKLSCYQVEVEQHKATAILLSPIQFSGAILINGFVNPKVGHSSIWILQSHLVTRLTWAFAPNILKKAMQM